jgi:hypothetical protein
VGWKEKQRVFIFSLLVTDWPDTTLRSESVGIRTQIFRADAITLCTASIGFVVGKFAGVSKFSNSLGFAQYQKHEDHMLNAR